MKALIKLTLVVAILLLPLASGMKTPEINKKVTDPLLRHKLDNAEKGDKLEVIIQFEDKIEKKDLKYLKALNFKIHKEFRIIPAVFATGTKDSIITLSNYQRIHWIEYNAPLKYYMDESAKTIKADYVWERSIIENEEFKSPIDGSGVTVVVLDSGIDGSHPDLEYTPINMESGETPEEDDKVIYNVKSDQNPQPWVTWENTDTSSGHGTHCAGTVGGTGDASAGKIKGIAPNVWLIGVSMGELFATIDEYNALVWVYEHSKPGNNPANIRVVTNSWGPGEPFDNFDPNDASIKLINKLTYENNVAVIFAAGNAGENNHDGSTDTVNIFGKVPAAISVAATLRNGKGLANFSSRGQKDKIETYPDIAAPGVQIWSSAARMTLIGGAILTQDYLEEQGAMNPYYLAISGTSMATPHVAGLAALLFQACPSLTISDVDEDIDEAPITISDNEGDEYQVEETKIHEIELILKLTADYIQNDGENGVPSENITGILNRSLDYAQGYGLVNAEKAVGVALALTKLRDPDGNGVIDNNASVFDALNKYEGIITGGLEEKETDVITAKWDGEFIDADSSFQESEFYGDVIPASDQRHSLFIPGETKKLKISLDYIPLSTRTEATALPSGSYSDLHLIIDADGDGNRDSPQGPIVPDPIVNDPSKNVTKTYEFGPEDEILKNFKGSNWTFDIIGYSFGNYLPQIDKGARNEYSINVEITLDTSNNPVIDFRGFDFGEPSSDYEYGTVMIQKHYYDLSEEIEEGDEKDDDKWKWIGVLGILAFIAIIILFLLMRKKIIKIGKKKS